MDCNNCNMSMVSIKSQGNSGKFIIFDLENKNESGNFTTKDGLVIDAYMCTSCGEYRFKSPKE